MRGERMKAMMLQVEGDVRFVNAAVVALGCFFLLYVFSFYPIFLVPLIALLCGVIAFRSPPFGTIAASLFAMPAVAYQSGLFGWIFVGILSFVMIKAFDEHLQAWKLISVTYILTMSPFTIFGPLVIPFYMVSGLLLGSKKGAMVAFFSVLVVLSLSVMWQTQNNGYMFYDVRDFSGLYNTYGAVFKDFKLDRPALGLTQTFIGFSTAAANMFDVGNILKNLNYAINGVLSILLMLFITPYGLSQVIAWTGAVFLIGFLPGRTRYKSKNVVASAWALIIVIEVFIAAFFSDLNIYAANPFLFSLPNYVVLLLAPASFLFGLGTIWLLEKRGVDLSREAIVLKEEKEAKFSEFGLRDLSLTAGVESLSDVGGYEETKQEIIDTIVKPMKKKEYSTAYGLKPAKGILFFGPPGTGKTMMMRALAKELDIGFYYIKSSDLLSQWYGETEQRITKLFKTARDNAPCVLFFDEIDAIGKKRDRYSSDDVGPRILSTLLQEMDGFKSTKDVIIIGATNIPREIDPALMRPGRFDKILYMPLPDKHSREEIFEVHARKFPVADDVDFKKLAAKSERYSGADIANLCTEAARRAARLAEEVDRVVPVTMNDFLEVIDSMRPSTTLSQLEDYEEFRNDFERRSTPLKKEKEKPEDAVRWEDVVGLDDVREALLEALEIPLLHEELMKEYKVKPIKGVLLFGPPGCGKTMIVKAASNELDATFLYLSGAGLMKTGFQNAVSTIKETFNRAREKAPAIIFIDEVESIAQSRDMAVSSVGEKVITQLLTEMDGVKGLKNVMLIGATNKPELLDPALLRPGRFDKIMFIHPPLKGAREELFMKNLEGVPLSKKVDFGELAEETDGYTGADIASIAQEAKMKLVRSRLGGKRKVLKQKDLLKIIDGRRASVTPAHLKTYFGFLEEYGERR